MSTMNQASEQLGEVRVVGLDLDQTLYQRSPEIDKVIQTPLIEAVAQHYGCSFEEAHELFQDLYDGGAGLSGSKTLQKLGIMNASEKVQDALENAAIEECLTPNDNDISTVRYLREKYIGLDILTGSTREQAIRKLGKLAIDIDMFDHVITGDEASKSEGTAYQLWLEEYPGLEPDKFLYIGDRPSTDHVVPHSLGIKTVLVYATEALDDYDCPQCTNFSAIRNYV